MLKTYKPTKIKKQFELQNTRHNCTVIIKCKDNKNFNINSYLKYCKRVHIYYVRIENKNAKIIRTKVIHKKLSQGCIR